MTSEIKTLKEKATEVVSQFCEKTGVLSMDGGAAQELVEMIRMALEDQDRETSRACAEALKRCEDMNEDCGDTDVVWLDAEEAYNACMNVRAE